MHICVIGAGVVGVTTAYLLSEAGHRVTLIEAAADPAQGTSFANGGQLSFSYVAPLAAPGVLNDVPRWLLNRDAPLRFTPRLDPQQWRWSLAFAAACRRSVSESSTRALLALSYLSRDTLHALLARQPVEFGWRKTGKLIVYRQPALVEKARAQVAYQALHGARQQVLDAERTLTLEPALQGMRDQLAGSVFTADDESGDCLTFTRGLFEALRSRANTNILMSTTVLGLRRTGRKIAAARLAGGKEMSADAFVIAAGMGSSGLLRDAGLRSPLYPLKGYSLSLPLTDSVAPWAPEISVTDYERRIVYARVGRSLRIAAMVDIGSRDGSVDPVRIATLKRQVKEVFPDLPLDEAQAWAGMRPATATGRPAIGAAPRADNLYLNIGQGALGFTLACGSAAVVQALIENRPSPIDAAPFAPR